jgi:hypothetical protein
MLIKIAILIFGAFSAGLAAGNCLLFTNDGVLAHDTAVEQKFFLQTNPIKTINPATECRDFNESLSFEQNLINCTRSNVDQLDI